MPELTAKEFTNRLEALKSEAELKKYDHYFPAAKRGNDKFMGVRMGDIFKLSKEFIDMPLSEVEKLLESPYHESRTGGAGIMDEQARSKKYDDKRKKELFKLYLRKHDRINTWDLVDRSGFRVIGSYVAGHPEKMSVLEKLAHSKQMAERRTAIVAAGQIGMETHNTEPTFKIAAMLVTDADEFVQKAVGWMLRVAGDIDKPGLLSFLDAHAAKMSSIMLSYATEKQGADTKAKYRSLRKGK